MGDLDLHLDAISATEPTRGSRGRVQQSTRAGGVTMRWRSRLGWRTHGADIEDEIASHLQLAIQDRVDSETLIGCRLLGMIDDQVLDLGFFPLELESQLLLKRREDVRTGIR
jgi:hypothetical protein